MKPWKAKVDERLLAPARPAGPEVRCLIRVEAGFQDAVGNLVTSRGGRVDHQMMIVPGLTAFVPRGALRAVAQDVHVLRVEAESAYRPV